jgi:uncharacterized protein
MDIITVSILCSASFFAGFIDSMVGGGGLIQLPALLIMLPGHSLIQVLATNKLISMSGTALSAWRYSRHFKIDPQFILSSLTVAFILALIGAYTVSIFPTHILRPIFFILIFLVFLLTLKNQQMGMHEISSRLGNSQLKLMLMVGGLGFYDGFFGPGTGSFLILGFISLSSMNYLQASAQAKIINLSTNLAALLLFSIKTKFLFQLALPMMFFNMAGSFLGVKLTLLKGNIFLRTMLRIVIALVLVKMAYDLWGH